MPINGTGWKLITSFAAIAGFMVSVVVYRTNDMDERLRVIEIRQAQMWCSLNPEACVAEINAPLRKAFNE